MAEAGNWSRLSKEKLRAGARAKTGSGILARLQAWSARVACMEASQKH
jgi:hypothetical protein